MSQLHRNSAKKSIARWISIVGHPFVCLALATFFITYRRGGLLAALRVAGLLVCIVVLPLAIFIRRRRRSGKWQTVDASAPKDRPALYVASSAAIVPLALWFMFAERSADLMRGVLAAAAILAVAAFLNRWIKLSLHMAFAIFCGLLLGRIWTGCAVAFAIFLPLLAWSRLTLSRHTVPQVIGGASLGGSAACLVIWG